MVYEFHSFNEHPVSLLHRKGTLELKFKFQFLFFVIFFKQKDLFPHMISIMREKKKVKIDRRRKKGIIERMRRLWLLFLIPLFLEGRKCIDEPFWLIERMEWSGGGKIWTLSSYAAIGIGARHEGEPGIGVAVVRIGGVNRGMETWLDGNLLSPYIHIVLPEGEKKKFGYYYYPVIFEIFGGGLGLFSWKTSLLGYEYPSCITAGARIIFQVLPFLGMGFQGLWAKTKNETFWGLHLYIAGTLNSFMVKEIKPEISFLPINGLPPLKPGEEQVVAFSLKVKGCELRNAKLECTGDVRKITDTPEMELGDIKDGEERIIIMRFEKQEGKRIRGGIVIRGVDPWGEEFTHKYPIYRW